MLTDLKYGESERQSVNSSGSRPMTDATQQACVQAERTDADMQTYDAACSRQAGIERSGRKGVGSAACCSLTELLIFCFRLVVAACVRRCPAADPSPAALVADPPP